MPERVLTILPDPARPYAALKADLVQRGWVWANEAQVRPLLPGEPEWVEYTHSWGGHLRYEFNPAIGLRRIEARGPENLLAALALLPRLYLADVDGLLGASRGEDILRGLFALRALGATASARARVHALFDHPDDLIRRAAAETLRALVAVETSPDLRVLCERALPFLAALMGPDAPDIIEYVRPRPADYDAVFAPRIAAAARAAYVQFWARPRVEPLAAVKIIVFALPARALLEDSELSKPFPAGYRRIASQLQPDRIWLVWRYLRPGDELGVRYDGLVWLDDRWAWFPKPYRVLESERKQEPN